MNEVSEVGWLYLDIFKSIWLTTKQRLVVKKTLLVVYEQESTPEKMLCHLGCVQRFVPNRSCITNS